ncbi:tetratricopeptide repeat protein [Moorena sp. SIO3H5]|uniref:tetratricopeptide repeat protein n=1 Tax=Moorena sp. SIO3H5 TaxID=2607834 RepID=UPI0013B79D38|nr:tetratricopeptide repeat protein [Moorena sp. SIO3H5]NEO69310.1 tetratricopeptide repeat protein [Moorena sp. SIO3H5]
MTLKSELLTFLSGIPNTQTVRERQAFLATVGLDRLDRQIACDGIQRVFFNELLKQLCSEGQTSLVDFLRKIVESDWIGQDDRQKCSTFADKIQTLTTEEWQREFRGSTDNNASSLRLFGLPQKDTPKFTGREDELRRLEEVLLSQEDHKGRIVVITGTGGMGKSTLASHFATIHDQEFSEGVVTVRVNYKDQDSKKYVNKDLDSIAKEFASLINQRIEDEDYREPKQIMQTLFAPRDMLLIFDSAEEASIEDLLPEGNNCAVIVTTRNQALPSFLDVAEDQTIRLRSLPEKDALKLLGKMLDLELDEESKSNTKLAAQRITKIVGRLPLALRIVGAALRGQRDSLDDYAQALEEEKDKLLEELKTKDNENLDVETSLKFSLNFLSEDEKNCFACLSVCAAEGFTKETAIVTAGLQKNLQAQRKLRRIYNLSLLDYVDTGENRYVLHPLVRVYAMALAHERRLLATAQERHAKFFVESLKTKDLKDEKVVDEAAADLDDMLLAAEWLQKQEAETEQIKWENYEFVLQLQRSFEKHGYWNKAIALTKRFQSWAQQVGDWNAVVKYKMHQARNWSFAKEFEEAKKILKSAQSYLPKIEKLETRKEREAKVLNVLGGVYQKQGNLELAIETFNKQIDIDETIDNDRSRAITLNRLGRLLQEDDKLEEAEQAFEKGIKIAKAIKDQYQLANGRISLYKLHLQQGNIKIEEVKGRWRWAILIIQHSGELRRAATSAMTLGGELYKRGYLSEALKIFLIAADLHKSFNSDGLVSTLRDLAKALSNKKSFEEALEAINAAIKICLNTDNQKNHKKLATLYNIRGKILQEKGRQAKGKAQGNLNEAQQAFEQQIKIAKDTNDQKQLAIGLPFLFKNKFKQEKEKEAFKILNEAIDLSDDINPKDYASMLFRLADFLKESKKFIKSWEVFKLLENYHEHLESNTLIYSIRKLANKLYNQQNDEEALQATRLAINISIKTSNHKQLEEVIDIHKLKNYYTENDIHKILSDSLDLADNLGNERGKAIIAISLGQYEEALQSTRSAINIYIKTSNHKELEEVMDIHKLKKYYTENDIHEILSDSFDLADNLGNQLGEAMITNSFGQFEAHQEGEENFKRSQMYFRRSIQLCEELNDQPHLAKVHTAMGQALIDHGYFEKAVEALSKGFEIDESLSNIRGLKIVTRNLIDALFSLEKGEEALAYCDRALEIAPNYLGFLQLRDQIQTAISKGIHVRLIKIGRIRYIRHNPDNSRSGRIAPDDGSSDITFNEKYIGSYSASQLTQGALVEVEVNERYGKLYAKQVRVIEEEEEEG